MPTIWDFFTAFGVVSVVVIIVFGLYKVVNWVEKINNFFKYEVGDFARSYQLGRHISDYHEEISQMKREITELNTFINSNKKK